MNLLEHVCPEDIYTRLAKRWQLIEADELGELDPLLVKTMRFLNQIPEITTVFSCQGHPENDDLDQGYVMLAVRDLEVAYAVYSLFTQHYIVNQESPMVHMLGLKLTFRSFYFGEDDMPMYPAVIISWPANHDDWVDLAIKCLQLAVIDYLKERELLSVFEKTPAGSYTYNGGPTTVTLQPQSRRTSSAPDQELTTTDAFNRSVQLTFREGELYNHTQSSEVDDPETIYFKWDSDVFNDLVIHT